MMYTRNLKDGLLAAAQDTPVVLLNGARQTGKSTLLGMFDPTHKAHIISLDDLTVLQAIRNNAQAFLAGLQGERIIIDEVQRAPELFLPLKEVVDRRRQPGRFFLTGSANVLMLPKLADSLAGRMEIATLWPLSQGELRGRKESFIDLAFSKERLPSITACSQQELFQMLEMGGYPEVMTRSDPKRRVAWFHSYINTILQRDVQDLSKIEGLAALPNLLTLLASRAGGLLNAADLSRSLGLTNPTFQRYLNLLIAVFLVVSITPWFTNLGKRLVKAPKLYLSDTGLLCHLLGIDHNSFAENRNLLGPVLENFVVMELLKQSGWSEQRAQLSHYRTHTGQEVDIVLESGQQVVGIEIKSASRLTSDHFKGLRHLREELGQRFHRGVILYSGREVVQLEDKIWAAPVSILWEKA